MSRTSVACSRGITSRWPRVAGLMSMNAIVRSSSCTRVEGTSPATILQNRQSGSAAIDRRRVLNSLKAPCRAGHRPPARHRRAPRLASTGPRPPRASGGRRSGSAASCEALGVAGARSRRSARSARWRCRSGCCRPRACWRRSAGAAPRRSGCWRRRGSSTTSRGGPHVFRRAAPATARPTTSTATAGDPDARGHARVRRPPRRRQRRPDLPPRADAARRRHVPGAGTSARRTSPQMMRLVAAGPALAALGALLGSRPLRQLGLRSSPRAARSRSSTSAPAPSSRAPTTTSPRSPCCSSSRGCCARSRSRGVRVLLVSTGSEESFMEGMRGWVRRHGPRLDPDAHPGRGARDARLAGADPARGRGDDLDDRLRRRACATSSPTPRSDAGVAAAARAAARLRHRRAVGAARRAARPPRSPPATSTRCPPTTTRSATSRATSTSRRWRAAARVAEAAIRSAASARG